MALVPCPECHKEVSTEARACPQCAFPSPGKHALEEERASGLHTCPQCHGLVSPDSRTCPYCRVSLAGGLPQQEDNGESFQETLVCPHCRASYIHTRKVPQPPVKSETTSPGTIPPVTSGKRVATKASRDNYVEPLRKTTALLGPRRPSALWQDPSGSPKVPPPRYPRSKKNSILIGLILLVIVTISVVFGAIWQLNGLNPLETILSWRM